MGNMAEDYETVDEYPTASSYNEDDSYAEVGDNARLEDYLDSDEIDDLEHAKDETMDFEEGELESMMRERPYESDSSFYDDGIPPSEDEYFSSDYNESDVGDYIPPLTNTRKALIYRLLKYQTNPNDTEEEGKAKIALRGKALHDFRNFILKKRAAKAYRRFMKLRDMEMDDPDQEAFLLEKMEIVDKKLHRKFYYEEFEPWTYKKLLQKRRRAIKRKYELYALDPDFRREYQFRILRNVGKFLVSQVIDETPANPEYDWVSGTETGLLSGAPSSVTAPVNKESSSEEDLQSVSEGSSFYDDIIPQSELDFFSSEYEEDCDVHYPGPKSKRLERYRRHLRKCGSQFFDSEEQKAQKKIRAAEVEAQFKNYIEKRRALKSLARYKIIEGMNLEDDAKKAEMHLNMEIVEKKLHRSYYYGKDEPETYKILLAKRRRAVIRKYERYAEDEDFRNQLFKNIYTSVMRIRPSPLFDKDKSDDGEESSFNDSEVPSSEEKFMSEGEIRLPRSYEKPITRTKKQLYQELEQYEPDGINDTEDIIVEKRKRRLDLIQRFKDNLANRRAQKAVDRFHEVNKIGSKDPYLIATALKEREIVDKKLHRGYYYSPGEPEIFKQLLEKRLRAIDRKYRKYATDRHFRDAVNAKITSAQPKIAEADEQDTEWFSLAASSQWGASLAPGRMVIGDTKAADKRRKTWNLTQTSKISIRKSDTKYMSIIDTKSVATSKTSKSPRSSKMKVPQKSSKTKVPVASAQRKRWDSVAQSAQSTKGEPAWLSIMNSMSALEGSISFVRNMGPRRVSAADNRSIGQQRKRWETPARPNASQRPSRISYGPSQTDVQKRKTWNQSAASSTGMRSFNPNFQSTFVKR